MLAGHDGLRLSLAGAQDKLPVVFDGARIGLPLNGTPSSHILKPAIQAVEDSVLNEEILHGNGRSHAAQAGAVTRSRGS
jgi:serine/threonine-protein kinase HipA